MRGRTDAAPQNEPHHSRGRRQGIVTISVVIPCYNAARFIGAAIESALAQTRRPEEILVVDDGSMDESAAVAERYGPMVQVLRRPHEGTSAARNAGLAAATGELVAWLDADDLWLPEKLEWQERLFDTPKIGLVYAQRVKFLDGSPPDDVVWPRELPGGDVLRRLYFSNFIPSSTVVGRRQAFVDAGGFDTRLSAAVDYDMWLRVAVDWHFAGLDQVLLHYRLHSSQISRNRAKQLASNITASRKVEAVLEARSGVRASVSRRQRAWRAIAELEKHVLRDRRETAAPVADVILREFPELGVGAQAWVRGLKNAGPIMKPLIRWRRRSRRDAE